MASLWGVLAHVLWWAWHRWRAVWRFYRHRARTVKMDVVKK
jgi:hypothetical protein